MDNKDQQPDSNDEGSGYAHSWDSVGKLQHQEAGMGNERKVRYCQVESLLNEDNKSGL